MRALLTILLLLPIACFSQNDPQEGPPPYTQDSSLLIYKMFSLTPPNRSLHILMGSEKISENSFVYTFTQANSTNLRSLQAGILASDITYAVLIDTSKIQSALFRLNSFSTFNNFEFPSMAILEKSLAKIDRDSLMIGFSQSFKYWSMEKMDNS